jgi:hypothetical protein
LRTSIQKVFAFPLKLSAITVFFLKEKLAKTKKKTENAKKETNKRNILDMIAFRKAIKPE